MTRQRSRGPPVPPDGGYGWIIALASFGIHVIVDGIAFTFGVLFEEFAGHFEEKQARTALVGAVLTAAYLMSAPLASVLVNRFGCRPVVIAGSVIATFGFAICRLSESIDTLTITYGFIGGVGLGLMFLPAIVSVSFYFDKRRAFATGIAVCGAGVGCFIFAPAGNLLLQVFDWKNSMLIIAAITAHGVVFGALLTPLQGPPTSDLVDNNNQHARLSGSKASVASQTNEVKADDVEMVEMRAQNKALLELEDWSDIDVTASAERGSTELETAKSKNSETHISVQQQQQQGGDERWLCFACRRPTLDCLMQVTGLNLFKYLMFVIPFFANLFACVGLLIPFMFIVARAKANGVSESNAVFLLSAIAITNTLGRIMMGFLADLERVSALLLHNMALLTAGVACLLVRFCVVYWTMVIFALVIGLCVATWITLTSIVLCELLGLEKLTNSFGLLCLVRGFAILIGPPIAGFVYDWTQNYDNSFMVASIMFLAAGAICCVLHLPRFQRQKFAAQQQQPSPSPAHSASASKTELS